MKNALREVWWEKIRRRSSKRKLRKREKKARRAGRRQKEKWASGAYLRMCSEVMRFFPCFSSFFLSSRQGFHISSVQQFKKCLECLFIAFCNTVPPYRWDYGLRSSICLFLLTGFLLLNEENQHLYTVLTFFCFHVLCSSCFFCPSFSSKLDSPQLYSENCCFSSQRRKEKRAQAIICLPFCRLLGRDDPAFPARLSLSHILRTCIEHVESV